MPLAVNPGRWARPFLRVWVDAACVAPGDPPPPSVWWGWGQKRRGVAAGVGRGLPQQSGEKLGEF